MTTSTFRARRDYVRELNDGTGSGGLEPRGGRRPGAIERLPEVGVQRNQTRRGTQARFHLGMAGVAKSAPLGQLEWPWGYLLRRV